MRKGQFLQGPCISHYDRKYRTIFWNILVFNWLNWRKHREKRVRERWRWGCIWVYATDMDHFSPHQLSNPASGRMNGAGRHYLYLSAQIKPPSCGPWGKSLSCRTLASPHPLLPGLVRIYAHSLCGSRYTVKFQLYGIFDAAKQLHRVLFQTVYNFCVAAKLYVHCYKI